jgi:hypothetical protein
VFWGLQGVHCPLQYPEPVINVCGICCRLVLSVIDDFGSTGHGCGCSSTADSASDTHSTSSSSNASSASATSSEVNALLEEAHNWVAEVVTNSGLLGYLLLDLQKLQQGWERARKFFVGCEVSGCCCCCCCDQDTRQCNVSVQTPAATVLISVVQLIQAVQV